MYHIVCSAKYRRAVFDKKADEVLRDACLGISKRYDVDFIEIGVDKDHVHFLVQSVPMYSPKKLVQGGLTASVRDREVKRMTN